jgi:hypothetical protein
MLIRTENGTAKHIEPVHYIHRVPSKRAAEAAYAQIVAALPEQLVTELSDQIELVRDFIRSR